MRNGFRFGIGLAIAVACVAGLAWMILQNPKELTEAGGMSIMVVALLFAPAVLAVLCNRIFEGKTELGIGIVTIGFGIAILLGAFTRLFPNSPNSHELVMVGKIGGWVMITIGALPVAIHLLAAFGIGISISADGPSISPCPHAEWERMGWFRKCKVCGHRESTEFKGRPSTEA